MGRIAEFSFSFIAAIFLRHSFARSLTTCRQPVLQVAVAAVDSGDATMVLTEVPRVQPGEPSLYASIKRLSREESGCWVDRET